MRSTVWAVFLLLTANAASAQTTTMPSGFDINAAERFANLALACVHKEYPNKLNHSLNSDADVAPPRKLTPAFYGCYDWHSSVHGHWLLVRLIRTFPDATFAPSAREALRHSLTTLNITQEAAYLRAEGRASFERPYGLAWLLQLVAELREWDDPQAREMGANLRPLEEAALERLNGWLPKLSHPVRIGEHDQTAFALEADVMRRVLPGPEFARWLRTFLPQISRAKNGSWLQPVVSPDPSDPKLAHLDGLNLSRAWMLEGIAAGLPKTDKRLPMIMAAAEEHKRAGLAAVTGKHYEGGHWLGSFAVYLVTKRGIPQK